MFFSLKNQKIGFYRVVTFSQALLLGSVASLLFSSNANATKIIDVKYKETEFSIKTKELKKFAKTGEIPPDLQQFFNDTEQVPEFLSNLLNKEIYISRSLVEDVLESTTGEFLLLKLNQAIDSSSSTEDLDAVKEAVVNSYENDRKLSMMELLSEYPKKRIEVDLTGLEGTYNDANQLVEKILPIWEIAKSLLEDVVCDCEQ
ncbi:Alpha/beta hydrolase of unknown function (DUF1400) [Xenococcus sp. PCC 7305]|uniref:alpha/beta hydrolase n=1 Tax=Xenococcus sp. PCC 7305 TaxID=102125 RepID=UPI0002AC582B|nr:alpha/beta hydrolase [Xenococcus sp. PCC 7305]ELS02004.1 Alpha/beta hydrolase of unknown function (DUF1400) [Xenococcus sp. PCC 7305]